MGSTYFSLSSRCSAQLVAKHYHCCLLLVRAGEHPKLLLSLWHTPKVQHCWRKHSDEGLGESKSTLLCVLQAMSPPYNITALVSPAWSKPATLFKESSLVSQYPHLYLLFKHKSSIKKTDKPNPTAWPLLRPLLPRATAAVYTAGGPSKAFHLAGRASPFPWPSTSTAAPYSPQLSPS